MKKNLLPILLAVIVIAGTQSCQKVDALKTSIQNQSVSFPFNGVVLHERLDATSTFGQFSVKEKDVYLNMDSVLTVNKVDKTKIKALKLQKITFTITDGADNFNFLQSMESRFAAGAGNTTTTSIATTNPVEKGVSTFTMDVENLDMKPYIDERNFTFEFIGETKSPIEHAVNFDVSFTFQIDAYVLQ